MIVSPGIWWTPAETGELEGLELVGDRDLKGALAEGGV